MRANRTFSRGRAGGKFFNKLASKSGSVSRPHGTRSRGSGIMKSSVGKRSIVVAGHKTSVSLEEAFWNCLKEISGLRAMTLSELWLTRSTAIASRAIYLRRFVCSFSTTSRAALRIPHRSQGRTRLHTTIRCCGDVLPACKGHGGYRQFHMVVSSSLRSLQLDRR